METRLKHQDKLTLLEEELAGSTRFYTHPQPLRFPSKSINSAQVPSKSVSGLGS